MSQCKYTGGTRPYYNTHTHLPFLIVNKLPETFFAGAHTRGSETIENALARVCHYMPARSWMGVDAHREELKMAI
jgi:hypothetical protein